ncbi:unnamed protein product [Leptidea sinapis]|uniref:Uncharacterized protein n=1 Tax=Leptidea sinapis TaxID=189913 RepID=A0A5E4QER3_9NEOP|nr:unnamed protein product [Leptidea sinapis]
MQRSNENSSIIPRPPGTQTTPGGGENQGRTG